MLSKFLCSIELAPDDNAHYIHVHADVSIFNIASLKLNHDSKIMIQLTTSLSSKRSFGVLSIDIVRSVTCFIA